MTKERLVEIIKSIDITYDEGITKDKNKNVYPRVILWEYYWEPLTASNQEYDTNTNVTYQISFLSNISRDKKLLKLRKLLAENKVFPNISHEYVEKDKCWHSYFSVEVLEKIE